MNKKGNKQFVKIILGTLIIVWFFVSAIAMYYFSNKSSFKVIMIFGQCFFVFGILSLITNRQDMRKERENRKKYHIYNKIQDDRPIYILLMLFGALMGAFGAFHEWGSTGFKKYIFEYGDPIYLLLFIIFAVSFFLFLKCKLMKYKKRCTVEVSAKVIDVLKECVHSSFTPDKFIYAPVIKYSHNDKVYTVETDTYSSVDIPQINDIITICINPQDPQDYCFPKQSKIILNSLGIVLAIMVIGCCIGLYNFFF